MVAKYLVEALQAHAFCFFLLVVADLRSAPDALDLKRIRFFFSFLLHAPKHTEKRLLPGIEGVKCLLRVCLGKVAKRRKGLRRMP